MPIIRTEGDPRSVHPMLGDLKPPIAVEVPKTPSKLIEFPKASPTSEIGMVITAIDRLGLQALAMGWNMDKAATITGISSGAFKDHIYRLRAKFVATDTIIVIDYGISTRQLDLNVILPAFANSHLSALSLPEREAYDLFVHKDSWELDLKDVGRKIGLGEKAIKNRLTDVYRVLNVRNGVALRTFSLIEPHLDNS